MPRPGTRALNAWLKVETKDWIKREAIRLRLSQAEIVEIAINNLREYIAVNGDSRFLPLPENAGNSGNGNGEE